MTLRGRHRQVKVERPCLFLLKAEFKAYTELLGGLRHPGVVWAVCVVLSHWPVPVFSSGILVLPPLSSGYRYGPARWEHVHLVYSWVYNRGFTWRPAWVLSSCSRKSWSCCCILSCRLSCSLSCCCRFCVFSSPDDGHLSSSELESSPCCWYCSSPSVGGNILGLFGFWLYSS